jgi:hypothetical protein
LNGIETKDDIVYYWILVSLIIGFLYFKYIAEYISLLFFMFFLKDEQIDKPLLIRLNLAYILFVLVLNVVLANYTNLNFNKIPKAFPNERIKSEDELEYQDWKNDLYNENYDYR